MPDQREVDRTDRDLAALAGLALLCTGPRHPYDIHRLLVDTGKRFVPGLPRSLYHAVDKLEQARLIEPVATEHQPGRPERKVYAVTDAGRDEARRRVEVLLATPTADADLTYAALSFVPILPRERAVAALHARIETVGTAIERIETDLKGAADVHRLLLIESEFELARLRAERDWMTAVVGQVESGELEWLDANPPIDLF